MPDRERSGGSFAMAGPGRARHRARMGSRRPNNVSNWRSFLTYRIASAGVVTAFGAVTRPAEFAQSCPACPCCVAGDLPSSREGDRNLFVFSRGWRARQRSLPSSSCLVHEAAHPNVHHNTQRQEHKQNGRPTIAHKWQGYSCDRHKTDHHANVNQDMKAENSHHTHH